MYKRICISPSRNTKTSSQQHASQASTVIRASSSPGETISKVSATSWSISCVAESSPGRDSISKTRRRSRRPSKKSSWKSHSKNSARDSPDRCSPSCATVEVSSSMNSRTTECSSNFSRTISSKTASTTTKCTTGLSTQSNSTHSSFLIRGKCHFISVIYEFTFFIFPPLHTEQEWYRTHFRPRFLRMGWKISIYKITRIKI